MSGFPSEPGARDLVAADHLLLLAHRSRVPVLDGDMDPAHDKVGPAAHPTRALCTCPNELLELGARRIDRSVLEPLQVARRTRTCWRLVEAHLRPADRRDSLRHSE